MEARAEVLEKLIAADENDAAYIVGRLDALGWKLRKKNRRGEMDSLRPWVNPVTRRVIDADGYEVIPDPVCSKGVRCGRCGMTFDHDKTYGFVCQSIGCPLMPGGVT